MRDLIEALNILLKYGNPRNPTHCTAHDELTICGIDPGSVSEDDKKRLDSLGFFIDEDDGCFRSYRFGSA